MDTETIEELVQEYDRRYAGKLQSIEQRLNEALPAQGHITKAQLEDVLTWKFDGMAGRGASNIERMREVPDAFVRSVSEAALLVDNPKLQLETLNAIPGVGFATATVVLAFHDPARYAIGDRYIMHALIGEDRLMRATDYPEILEALKAINPGSYDLRTVEKAVYQQYRNEYEVGRFGE